jgi:tetratricopeptide (TPR) repeat protein
MRRSLYISLLFILYAAYVSASSATSEFDQANRLYRSGEYQNAAKAYEDLLSKGFRSSALYYNLGNAYYKQDQVAKAIINYERALKLDPRDEDIQFNLRLANLNTVDKIEPLPKLFYEQWWESFLSTFSSDVWSKLGITALWLAALFAAIYIFTGSVGLKKIGFFSAMLVMFTGFFFLFAGRAQHRRVYSRQSAVITETSAYVKSSPEEQSTSLFMLHSGTKIDIVDELQGWKKIRIANGNIGWVRNSELEVI